MDAPTEAYEQTYSARVVGDSSVVDKGFIKGSGGILKLIEVIISFIVILIASLSIWSFTSSGRWTNFVAAFTLIFAAFLFIFYLFRIIHSFRKWSITVEFISLIVSCILWAITFIVCAAEHRYGSPAIACAVFSFVAVVVYSVELWLRFRLTRVGQNFTLTRTGTGSANEPNYAAAATTTPGPYPVQPSFGDSKYPEQSQPANPYAMP